MQVKTTLFKLFKLICYVALIVVTFGALSLFLPFILDMCSNASGGTIACTSPTARSFYELGFTITMMAVFTGLPLLLALFGLIFFIKDLFFSK